MTIANTKYNPPESFTYIHSIATTKHRGNLGCGHNGREGHEDEDFFFYFLSYVFEEYGGYESKFFRVGNPSVDKGSRFLVVAQ